MNYCCGKAVCKNCSHAEQIYDEKADRCLLCNATTISSIGLVKKQAKRGRPWAQTQLGVEYHQGNSLAQSFYDAVRWYRKAAAKGHPFAMLNMNTCYRTGSGCTSEKQ